MRLIPLAMLEIAKLGIAVGAFGLAPILLQYQAATPTLAGLALGGFGIIATAGLVWSWLQTLQRWQAGELVQWAGAWVDQEVARRVGAIADDIRSDATEADIEARAKVMARQDAARIAADIVTLEKEEWADAILEAAGVDATTAGRIRRKVRDGELLVDTAHA